MTKEHVPPRGAYNKSRISYMLENGPGNVIKKIIKQGGVSFNVLCRKCNNDTGAWYGKDFIDMCRQGLSTLSNTGKNGVYQARLEIKPLSCIKQIVSMFHCIVPRIMPKFVLNNRSRYIHKPYKIFLYMSDSTTLRYCAPVIKVSGNTGIMSLFMEIFYPPFGYVLTFDSLPPHREMCDITHFSHYSAGETKELFLKVPLVSVSTSHPGEYPSAEKINRHLVEHGYKPCISVDSIFNRKL